MIQKVLKCKNSFFKKITCFIENDLKEKYFIETQKMPTIQQLFVQL